MYTKLREKPSPSFLTLPLFRCVWVVWVVGWLDGRLLSLTLWRAHKVFFACVDLLRFPRLLEKPHCHNTRPPTSLNLVLFCSYWRFCRCHSVWGIPLFVLLRQSSTLFALASIYYAVVRQFSSNGSTSKATAPLTPHPPPTDDILPPASLPSWQLLRPRGTLDISLLLTLILISFMCAPVPLSTFHQHWHWLRTPVSTRDTLSFFSGFVQGLLPATICKLSN